jgi:hypothetical protein
MLVLADPVLAPLRVLLADSVLAAGRVYRLPHRPSGLRAMSNTSRWLGCKTMNLHSRRWEVRLAVSQAAVQSDEPVYPVMAKCSAAVRQARWDEPDSRVTAKCSVVALRVQWDGPDNRDWAKFPEVGLRVRWGAPDILVPAKPAAVDLRAWDLRRSLDRRRSRLLQ